MSCQRHKQLRREASRRYYYKHHEQRKAEGREAMRKRYAANPEAERRKLREYRQQVRREVLTAYGGSCTCCGEAQYEFLALDHKYGTTGKARAAERKSGISWYLKLRREGYPDHIQILCHNCNAAKGFYGACPHSAG